MRCTPVTNTGQWYFLVGKREGNTISIYVNGVLEDTEIIPTGASINNITGREMKIGAIDAGVYANIQVDNLMIFDNALSDDQIATMYSGNVYAYYEPDVKSYSDYYPGHFLKPNRHANPGSYRYGGANGQESDVEITGSFGSHYTAEHWMFDSRLVRRWENDPVVKPWESPYATFNNNSIWLVDPNGDNADNYLIKENGKIEVQRTDDKTDNFKYQAADGTVTDLGTFSKNDNDLIGLPSSHNQGGVQFTYTGSTGENYISGEAMAALLGALKSTGITDLRLNHFSNADGTSPSPSKSHKDGTVGDLRPLRKDKTGNKVLVSDDQFDKDRNASLITALKKYGFTSILSETSGGYITPGTTHYSGYTGKDGKWVDVRHNNHFHIQKFKPKLTVVNELSIGQQNQAISSGARKLSGPDWARYNKFLSHVYFFFTGKDPGFTDEENKR